MARIATLLNNLQRGGLAVALSEDLDLQAEAMDGLRPRVSRRFHELTVTAEEPDVLALMTRAGVQAGEAVCLYGLSKAPPESLKILEHGRERVWAMEASLLLWVTGEGQRRLLEDAPNFYSRRVLLVRFTVPGAVKRVWLFVVDPPVGFERAVRQFRGTLLPHLAPSSVQMARQRSSAAGFSELQAALEAAELLTHSSIDQAAPSSGRPGAVVLTGEVPEGASLPPTAVQIRAAELMSRAQPGQVLIEEPCSEIKALGLESYFHGDLFEVLRPGQTPQSPRPAPIPTNLPPRPAYFIGRASLLDRLAASLVPGSRVQIVGPPGMGKTWVALEAAHSALEARRFPGGIAWIDGPAHRTVERMRVAISEALGLSTGLQRLETLLSPEPRESALRSHMRRRACLILVDDGDDGNEEVLSWLSSLPAAVAITCRQPLLLAGSREESLPPLTEREAKRLISHELHAGGVEASTADEAQEALLKAAAGFPGRLVEKVRGAREEPMDKRLDVLSPAVRKVWCAAGLFPAPFVKQALEAVTGAGDLEKTLSQLIEAGLLLREGVAYRFPTIETGRLAAQMASREVDKPLWETRFRAYYRELAGHFQDLSPDSRIEKMQSPFETLQAQRDNLAAALDRAETAEAWDDVEVLGTALCYILEAQGLLSEAEGVVQRRILAARKSGNHFAESDALFYLGLLLKWRGYFDEARQTVQSSLKALDGLPDPVRSSRLNLELGALAASLGLWNEADTCYGRALKLAESSEDNVTSAWIMLYRGTLEFDRQNFSEADFLARQGLALAIRLGNEYLECRATLLMGDVCQEQGRLEEAARWAERGRESAERLRSIYLMSRAHSLLGHIAVRQERFGEARSWLEEALDETRSLEYLVPGLLLELGVLAFHQGQFDEAANFCQRGLEIERNHHHTRGQVLALLQLSKIHLAVGAFRKAIEAAADAHTMAMQIHDRSALKVSEQLETLRNHMGTEAFEATWRSLRPDEPVPTKS